MLFIPQAPRAQGADLQLNVQGLNSPPVLANGISTAYIPILVKDEVGDLLLGGAAISGSATLGEVLDAWSAGPGVYLIRYRPPPVQLPESALLQLTVEQGNRRGEGTIEVSLVPAGRGSIEVRARPTPVILGEDSSTQLTFIARDVQGQPVSSSTLDIKTSTGTIKDISAMGNGRFTALYLPPEGNFPQVALITAIDTHLPDEIYGFFVLPLVGSTRFPVRTEAGLSLEFEVGSQVFGPFLTDAEGIAEVELLVPPGVGLATATSTDTDGNIKQERLDLSAPDSRNLALLYPPMGIAADGQSPVPLRILVVENTGDPRSKAPLRLMASTGSLSPVTEQGAGLYESYYTPPALDNKEVLTLTAYLDGEGEIQVNEVQVPLLPPSEMPAKPSTNYGGFAMQSKIDWLSLNLSTTQIAADTAQSIKVTVQGYGTSGLPVALQEDLVLVSSVGKFASQNFEANGSLAATLELPPMANGSSIAVVAADPVEGKSTWNLIYVGDKTASDWTPPPTPSEVDPEGPTTDTIETPVEPAPSDDSDGDTGNDSPDPIDVLRPPPPALRSVGTHIYPFYSAGYYDVNQVGSENNSTYPSDPWGIIAPTYLGLGVGVDHWFSSSLGLSGRVSWASYSFDSMDLLSEPGWASAYRTQGNIDLRWRRIINVDGRGLGLGLRAGPARQTYPAFLQSADQEKPEFKGNNALWLARVGADADLFLSKPGAVHASVDIGYDVLNPLSVAAPNTVHGELGFEWYVVSSLSVGVSADLWTRTILHYEEGLDDPSATLEDRWTRGMLYLRYHR